MEAIIAEIFQAQIGESPLAITEIVGLGEVNRVFDISCAANDYIVRLNEEENKQLEFLKEEWCITQAAELGIPGPKVISTGMFANSPYMIQRKIAGVNGSQCTEREKLEIWRALGEYAATYNTLEDIKIPALQAAEFHDDWRSKLAYNIAQLNPGDSLLSDHGFSLETQQAMKKSLLSLQTKTYRTGLVHGDLCPRNVIFNRSTTYLLDWGTAEIDIVPYNEIGLVLMEGKANEEEFKAFLSGMNISMAAYQEMEMEIWQSNLLHRLDKYRWASTYDTENLPSFVNRIKQTYRRLKGLK